MSRVDPITRWSFRNKSWYFTFGVP